MSRALVLLLVLSASTYAHADEACDTVTQAIKKKELTRASLLADDCADAAVATALDKARYARVGARGRAAPMDTGRTPRPPRSRSARAAARLGA